MAPILVEHPVHSVELIKLLTLAVAKVTLHLETHIGVLVVDVLEGLLREATVRVRVLTGETADGNRNDCLGLVWCFLEEILPVLILAFELFVGTVHGSFLLLKLAYLLFKSLDLLALFHTASNCTFSVLQSLPSLLVVRGVFSIVIVACPVLDLLL